MVYFIGNRKQKIVKVGYTVTKIEQRLHTIRANCPFEVECLLLIEGLKDTEQCLHKLFESQHIRAEWFKIEGEVEKYISNPKQPDVIETFKHTPRTDRIDKNNSDIEEMYKKCISVRKIAQELGYTDSQVRTFIKRHGLIEKWKGKRWRRDYTDRGHTRTPKTTVIPPVTKFTKDS